MITKENVKKYIDNAETDVLFEKFINLLPNDNDIIYEPKGLFNKGILNDTGRVTKKKNNLFIEINRPGFYDILPKGLFHNKLDDKNNQPQYLEQIENEKKNIRNLFLPFDSEIFSTIAKIEREGNNHFKYSFDSEIAISLLQFFRVFDEIDLLSLLETCFIDSISSSKKESVNFNSHSYIKALFPKNTSPYSLMVNLIDNSGGNSRILRFLNIIPFASENAGNIEKIEKLIQFVLAQKVSIRRVRMTKKYHSTKFNNSIGGNAGLNSDSGSLLLGNVFFDEPLFYDILIEIDTDNMMLMSKFQNGCLNKLTKVFLAFFLTFETEYEIKFQPDAIITNGVHHSFFCLGSDNDLLAETISKARDIVSIDLEIVSPLNQSFYSNMQEDVKLHLINYFNLYYSQLYNNDSKFARLTMNTKI
jgi:hypothetical protein